MVCAMAVLAAAASACEGLDDPAFLAELDRFVADANAASPQAVAAKAWTDPKEAGFVWQDGKWVFESEVWVWREGVWTPNTSAATQMVNVLPNARWKQRADGWHWTVD